VTERVHIVGRGAPVRLQLAADLRARVRTNCCLGASGRCTSGPVLSYALAGVTYTHGRLYVLGVSHDRGQIYRLTP